MGAVDHAFAIGNFVFAIDKDRAFATQFVNDKAVVNDLLAHVDRRAEGFERDADHIDRAHHPSAETTGLQQKQRLSLAICHL